MDFHCECRTCPTFCHGCFSPSQATASPHFDSLATGIPLKRPRLFEGALILPAQRGMRICGFVIDVGVASCKGFVMEIYVFSSSA